LKPRRISSSPLIDPAVSALIVMGPARAEPRSRGVTAMQHRAQAALLQAAAVIDVPTFHILRWSGERKHSQKPARSDPDLRRKFILDEYRCPWSERDFVDALLREDRSILLIIGSWLEHQIVGMALHGLAEGYDVCCPRDATTPFSKHAAAPARERLTQAGATPVVTSQVLHEWLVESDRPDQRATLLALLKSLNGRKVGADVPR
jgi:hypothetical protein